MFSRSINDNSIVIRMMIISDATTWSVTSDDSRGQSYKTYSFILLATVITIINYDHTVITIMIYDHKSFIVKATGLLKFGSCPDRHLYDVQIGRYLPFTEVPMETSWK